MGSKKKSVFESNRDVMTKHLDIHPYDLTILESSINELIDVGVGVIKEVTFEESNAYNWTILLTNNESQTYYLEMSEHGCIVVLKKDGSHGELVINYLSDDIEGISTTDDKIT